LRGRNAKLLLDDRHVTGDHLAPLVGADIGVEFDDRGAPWLVLEDFLEDLVIDPMTTSPYIWMKRR
jgi:hypothetical protein